MRVINVILALLVSLAIGLGVMEGGLRLIGKGPKAKLLDFDPVAGWANRPDAELTRRTPEFRVRFKTNSLGLRDDELPATKADEVFRVLALGDSFTLGFAVERGDHFVDLMEQRLRTSGHDVEIWNVGAEGWDTAQQAAWLEANGARMAPDLVLLLPYENDLYWNAQADYASTSGARDKPRYDANGVIEARELSAPQPKSFWKRTALGGLFDKPDASAMAAHVFTPDGAARPISKELAPLLESAPDFMADVRAHSSGALRAVRAASRALGAELVVAPIPAAASFENNWREIYDSGRGLAGVAWSPERPVDLWLELAEEIDVPAIDTRPMLRAARSATDERLYRKSDWHFGPHGSSVFADALIAALDGSVGGPNGEDSAAAGGARLPSAEPGAEPLALSAAGAGGSDDGGVPFWMKLFGGLWLALTAGYLTTYRDEPVWQPPLKIGALLAVVFATFIGIVKLRDILPPAFGMYLPLLFLVGVLGFVAYKLGGRLGTIGELLASFIRRGHWYLMPLVVVLLSIGSLLVVAASSPLVAPFIYTLF